MAKFIMVLGTGSFSGKSLIATALCRVFGREGYRVAPFKAQNTSLNSYVTAKGEEISRAQATQALAAGTEPRAEMNPILIKPSGDSTSQVVVMGKPYTRMQARHYYRDFALQEGRGIVERALKKLEQSFDIVVMEGAGSPAEINLYTRDIANLGAARIADAPALLVGDIDKGGVFASLYGTVKLVDEKDRERIRGIIINKFRGDKGILQPGLEELERLAGKKVLGVLPYLGGLNLPEEDSMGISSGGSGGVEVGVIRLPRISNFTDFDPLNLHGVRVKYISSPEEIGSAQAVIIPGSKNTLEDLKWLRERGFEEKLREIEGRKPLLGICGGFQMMGKEIVDGRGVEGKERVARGLGFFDLSTEFKEEKVLRRVDSRVRENIEGREIRVKGYEIHMGVSESREEPLFRGEEMEDGACIPRRRLMGTYLHGVFDSRDFRRLFLSLAGEEIGEEIGKGNEEGREMEEVWEESLDALAKEFESHIDVEGIKAIMGLNPQSQP